MEIRDALCWCAREKEKEREGEKPTSWKWNTNPFFTSYFSFQLFSSLVLSFPSLSSGRVTETIWAGFHGCILYFKGNKWISSNGISHTSLNKRRVYKLSTWMFALFHKENKNYRLFETQILSKITKREAWWSFLKTSCVTKPASQYDINLT